MSSVCLSRVCYSTNEIEGERERGRERKGERERGKVRENMKILLRKFSVWFSLSLCLFCLGFVVSSVCLSRVCYRGRGREREGEREREREKERGSQRDRG